jgi:Ca-activated chloride channel family protein
MMNFAHIEYLLGLLVLIPIVFIAIKFIAWKKNSWNILHTNNTKQKNTLLLFKLVFISFSIVFLIIGVADPLLSIGEKKITNEGIDILVAMDISTSMLATDVAPNRLTRAKMLVSTINKIIIDLD